MIRPAITVLTAALALTACAAPAVPEVTAHAVSAPHTMASDVPPYHRSAFGTGWAKVHGNCDVRETVLERDAGPNAVDTDGDGCRDDGPILDLYTGRQVDPHHADIDHVLPLALAWQEGAWRWTPAQRHAFYNDPANLRAVGESINRSKGESSPAQWKPPARSGWCTYAHAFDATAHKWHLNITPADQAATREMETTC